MLEIIENIHIPLRSTIFDDKIREYINEKFKDKMGDDKYKYNLTLYFHSPELIEENVNRFEDSLKREDARSLERIEFALRMLISSIMECLEDYCFSIHQVYVGCNQNLKNEIILEKSDVLWETNKKEKAKKIHLDVLFDNNERIHKIVDSIAF